MRTFVHMLGYRLTVKHVDESKLNTVYIELNKKEISYFNLSSNLILSFFYRGELKYFRECPKIQEPKEYLFFSVDYFFCTLKQLGISKEHFGQAFPIKLNFHEVEIEQFREYIQYRMRDKYFIKLLLNVDIHSAKRGFSIWDKQEYDDVFFHRFGLCGLPEVLYDIAVYFLWYMRSAIAKYRTMKIVRGKEHSFFSAVRSVSSKIVAEELGLSHMITDAEWCILKIDDTETKLGILSNSAPGKRMLDTMVAFDASLQSELINLNILDVITCQPDHGPNNYNVKWNGNAYSVCAFDNDNPRTFFPLRTINIKLSGCSTFISANGVVNRPHLDRQQAEAIKNLNFEKLRKRLGPYLNFLQIQAMRVRIKKLKKAIVKTERIKEGFLIDSEDWNEDTAREELSGIFGMTYLSRLEHMIDQASNLF